MSKQSGFSVVELLCVLGILGSLAFTGFVLWICWHFITKYW